MTDIGFEPRLEPPEAKPDRWANWYDPLTEEICLDDDRDWIAKELGI